MIRFVREVELGVELEIIKISVTNSYEKSQTIPKRAACSDITFVGIFSKLQDKLFGNIYDIALAP